ncbi:hypothetical protein B9L23_00980 [Parageobacillus galactosidasius]|uniref:Uncharacterized protein n=1 Tax=Parageobacillus galactosidasius TaxID=883812 RepID=A0A226QPS6_9BACL|nr:hypothetical protein B9L23_00980 [Parageobacillus galactosidasius]
MINKITIGSPAPIRIQRLLGKSFIYEVVVVIILLSNTLCKGTIWLKNRRKTVIFSNVSVLNIIFLLFSHLIIMFSGLTKNKIPCILKFRIWLAVDKPLRLSKK